MPADSFSTDQSDLEELFRTAGLEPVEIRLTGFPLGFVLQWARNILARRREVVLRPLTITTPDALKLRHEPVADCARYDRLRRAV